MNTRRSRRDRNSGKPTDNVDQAKRESSDSEIDIESLCDSPAKNIKLWSETHSLSSPSQHHKHNSSTAAGPKKMVTLSKGTLINRRVTRNSVRRKTHSLTLNDALSAVANDDDDVTIATSTAISSTNQPAGEASSHCSEPIEKEEAEDCKMAEIDRSPSALLSELSHEFPGRLSQLQTLLAYMGEPVDWVIPAMYVYGHPATGKTSLINSLMIKSEVPHCYVDLLECYSSRILYESVLNQLSGVKPSRTNHFVGYTRCDNLSDFVHHLKCVAANTGGINQQSIYIVIDGAERLINMEATVMPAFVQLAELTRLNLCVIMISTVVWEKFVFSTSSKQPVLLYFNQYHKDEVLEILVKDCPSNYSNSFFITYLTHIYNLVSPVSQDLRDIKYISNTLFSLYCEPIELGQASETETRKLLNHMEPHVKRLLTPLMLRDSMSEQFLLNRQKKTHSETTPTYSTHNPRLPYKVKFLLISAYLASYNPPKSDRKFFSKKKNKKGRSKRGYGKEELKRSLLGPKSFPLDRMMAIFHSITEEDIVPTPNLYSQISTLVSLHYLARIGGNYSLDTVKYKCLTTFEQIREISKSVDFEIIRYLHDYNF